MFIELSSRLELLNFDAIDILGYIILMVEVGVSSGTPLFYTLGASITTPKLWQPKISLDIVNYSLGGKTTPFPIENHCST